MVEDFEKPQEMGDMPSGVERLQGMWGGLVAEQGPGAELAECSDPAWWWEWTWELDPWRWDHQCPFWWHLLPAVYSSLVPFPTA